MATTALDTIEAVKRLTKEYEFSEKQAEGITVMLRDNVMSDLATKEDVRRIKEEVQDVKKDVQRLEEKTAMMIETALARHGKENFELMDRRLQRMTTTHISVIGVATAVIGVMIAGIGVMIAL